MKTISWPQALMAAVVFAVPATVLTMPPAQAVADEASEDGPIVEVSPSDGVDLPGIAENAQADAAPKYWIGLQGRPIDSAALRTHLQLANDVGVLVENVVPDSPAQKAGLQQYDVILAVNGEPIADFRALQKVVSEGGDKPIELKVIRLAKEEKVTVTPEERPADAIGKLSDAVPGGFGVGGNEALNFEDVIRQLQEGGVPGGMRMIGPGMGMGQHFNLNEMPNGISVSIQRDDDGPAEITVKKGEDSWTLKSDDEAAIKKLPEDVRKFVEGMAAGSRPGQLGQPGVMRFNFRDLQGMVPEELQQREGQVRERLGEARQRTEAASERLLKRMEDMEKRLQELQSQLPENSDASRTKEDVAPSKD